ncbi:carbamoyl-phosphate synthase large subunit [Paenarthrobacter nicotinovorans]|uniref:ATP-grasp domain-containing protein n=1 Tax=Micrococcaceae TaxID=1268 RepID=UPI0008775241|nr:MULTISPECIES: ATP-grasp domain-containing protein [Micrococcaceae]MDR6438031.1 carbamoyl-phosphate synthase large subunit [Paenarthrobacter nicotinovorans]SCZ62417.1 Carbamoylphosphate synthase large subunit [Arthrobacter sp. UNCCL28]
MVRVLVTGVGGPAGFSLARQLMDQGHWVLGVDMKRFPASTADALSVVSPSSAPGYLWELRGLVAAHGIDLVVPTVSDELVMVADARDGFAPGLEVLIADPEPVRIANDKYLTMKCLANANVAVPDFALPGDFSSINEAMARLGGSLVVKPRVSRGGRGVQLLERTADGARKAAEAWSFLDDSWIVQRFAPGTEYAPVVFRPWQDSGQEELVGVLEKVELKQGRIGNALSVKRVDGQETADVAGLAQEASAALGLVGPVDVDIRRMWDGTPVVLEVNARFGANSAYVPELLERVLRSFARGTLPGRAV